MIFEDVILPAAEVVSAADLKSWAKIDTTADDALVAVISAAARQSAEKFTGRRFITQTLRLWLDAWPRNRAREPQWEGTVEGPISMLDAGMKREIALVMGPIQSVSSLKYYGTDDTEYTVAAADYIVDPYSVPARIVLAFGKAWPATVLRPAKGVAVQFVAGYGAAGSAVPESIVTAIKIIGTVMYENRAAGCDTEIPALAKNLLDPYVVKGL